MMAQPFNVPPGMGGPGHPGMPHGHPMGVPHPGAGHMGGQPGPGAMMQGMHPGAGPQVSQGPMVTGMPPGAGTPAPMPNQLAAMAHMAPQQQMFQGQNPQMNLGHMQQQMNQQHQALLRHRMMMQHQQQQQQQQQHQQQQGMPMNMPNGAQFNPQQLAQMQMKMPMQPQHMAQMQAHNQQMQFQQHQQQQRMIQQQAAQAALQRAQSQQNAAAAQQMQMSRSQEQTTQAPPNHPTPGPTNNAAPPQQQQQPSNQPPQPQQQAQPQTQAAQNQPKSQPQSQPTPNPQQGTPQPQVKPDGPEEETPIKQQELAGQIMMQDIPKAPQNDFTGQCILQLLLYQDTLANPERPDNIKYWEETIAKYFSELGSIRQQLYNNRLGNDKSFQLQYPSIGRFYYLHFTNGIKQILMQSFDHNQSKLPNGGTHIWSNKASLTYVFKNDVRITTTGSLKVSFDDMQKIEKLDISTSGWTEYLPRNLVTPPSPNQPKSSPKMGKNQKKPLPQPPKLSVPMIPESPVSDFGIPLLIQQFLEIAEVMTAMGPLMEYSNNHPGVGPREALRRINNENQHMQMQMARMQNANAMAANGQVAFANQRAMGMQLPNQLQSPALQHLGLPPSQGSPHMGGPNHTPSPAHNPVGGMPMVHQMSAQGSNLSGSQGPSTNTSPNVPTKKRRQSVKMEDGAPGDPGSNIVKPSPQMGKRRKN